MRSSLAFQLRLQFVITRIICAAALRSQSRSSILPGIWDTHSHPPVRPPAVVWLHSVKTPGQKASYISRAFQKSAPPKCFQFWVFRFRFVYLFSYFVYFFVMEEKLIRVDLMEILVVIHNLVKR